MLHTNVFACFVLYDILLRGITLLFIDKSLNCLEDIKNENIIWNPHIFHYKFVMWSLPCVN
jgi:hypothetical protein